MIHAAGSLRGKHQRRQLWPEAATGRRYRHGLPESAPAVRRPEEHDTWHIWETASALANCVGHKSDRTRSVIMGWRQPSGSVCAPVKSSPSPREIRGARGQGADHLPLVGPRSTGPRHRQIPRQPVRRISPNLGIVHVSLHGLEGGIWCLTPHGGQPTCSNPL